MLYSQLTSLGKILNDFDDKTIVAETIIELNLILNLLSQMLLESSYQIDNLYYSDIGLLLALSQDLKNITS